MVKKYITFPPSSLSPRDKEGGSPSPSSASPAYFPLYIRENTHPFPMQDGGAGALLLPFPPPPLREGRDICFPENDIFLPLYSTATCGALISHDVFLFSGAGLFLLTLSKKSCGFRKNISKRVPPFSSVFFVQGRFFLSILRSTLNLSSIAGFRCRLEMVLFFPFFWLGCNLSVSFFMVGFIALFGCRWARCGDADLLETKGEAPPPLLFPPLWTFKIHHGILC